MNCLKKIDIGILLKYSAKIISLQFFKMNSNAWQKPFSSNQINPIQLQLPLDDYGNENSVDKIILEMSSKISEIMSPLYKNQQFQGQNGKVLGLYPVLRFPSVEETRNKIKNINSYSFEPQNSSNQKVNYKQISNRYQQKQKIQNKSTTQRKIHQILGQNEGKRGFDDDIFSSDNNFQNQNSELKKLQKARKYYEKLSKQLKSNKKMKRKFKDKNRPKKAKSAYNLFVQDVVPQIKAQNPSFNAPDLVRVAAKMYNKLTQEEKVPYQRRYLIDKQRFQRERQAYFKLNPQMDYRMDSKQKATYINNRNYMQM